MAPRKPAARDVEPRRSLRLAGREPVEYRAANRVTKSGKTPTLRPAKPKKPVIIECTSCGDTFLPRYFPKAITQTCNHEVATCKDCVKAWITAQIDTVTYDKIACPHEGCSERMVRTDVKSYATKLIYKRYLELELHALAERTPGYRWCLNPSCRAGQVHEPTIGTNPNLPKSNPPSATKPRTRSSVKKEVDEDDPNICKCYKCGALACVPCDRPYHYDETCEQAQKRKQQAEKDDKESEALIEQACKQCPKCKKNIEKKGGCDQMTCTQCGTRFCWLCMVSYDVINLNGHAYGCVYSLPGRFDPHAPHLDHQRLEQRDGLHPPDHVNDQPIGLVNWMANAFNGGAGWRAAGPQAPPQNGRAGGPQAPGRAGGPQAPPRGGFRGG